MDTTNFDDIISLEERFYDQGYKQGVADGVSAGRIEGRTLGLEKGFEKYVASGKLYGLSLVWANRKARSCEPAKAGSTLREESAAKSNSSSPACGLPPMPNHERLTKHLNVLHALAEPESLSTENTEEAVSEFDDRLKRAQGKAKIIERIIGESQTNLHVARRTTSTAGEGPLVGTGQTNELP